jgi:hypothetical protein
MKYFQTKHSKLTMLRSIILVLIISLLPIIGITRVNALPITGRSVVLSNSVGDASGVSYALTTAVLPTTATTIKSAEIKFCTSLTGACVKPTGFANASSTLASQPTGLGDASGWTVSTATDGSLRILNASNSTTPSGAVAITWNGVHNPTSTNETFYGVITTYSGSDWTTAVDTGSVALSTSAQIQVALTVDEALTFCTGTSITGQNCGTIAGTLVDLGNGSTTATAIGTSVMAASTNGATGYTITVNGITLASGGNTITALASGGGSTTGSRQFGLNLAGNNTTPAVGAAVSGTGSGAATTNYGTDDTFRFATGETVASASGPTNANTFTVGYIANIDGVTPVGAYTTNLTYIATANF